MGKSAETLIRLPEVLKRTGVSRAAIYLWVQQGQFPTPIKIGRNSHWIESEVQTWINEQIAKQREAV